MKLISRILIILFLVVGCQEHVEMNTASSMSYKKDKVVPVITSLIATQEKVTLTGKDLDSVTGARFIFEKKTLLKDFKIISREFGKLVLESIDFTPLPVDIALTLILDNAFGEHKFPVLFSLQDNAIKTRHIVDGNVTRLKLGKEEQDEPSNGDILKWDDSTGSFIFAPDDTGELGGSGTVTNIGLGNGIVGDGNAITSSGDVAVDIGVTGDPRYTKIPFFNKENQLVLEDKYSSSNPTKLIFANDSDKFSISNDNGLIIVNENEGNTLLSIEANGEVDVPGNLTVSGKEVCLKDGSNCPGLGGPGGIEAISVTYPLLGGGSDSTVNIAIDVGTGAGQVVQLDKNGALPRVDGTNLIGVVNGPAISKVGTAAFFSGSNGESIQGTDYRIPQKDGALGQVLTTDGSGNVSWEITGGGSGDVVGPDSSRDENITLFDGATGKLIKDSGKKISDFGDVKGSDISRLNSIAIYSNSSGKVIKSTPYSIPDTDGTLGQVLANNGDGKAIWKTIPQGGDVVGPNSAKTTSIALFSDGTGKKISGTFYGMPVSDGETGQVLATNGVGKVRWTTIKSGSGGDVSGPDGAVIGNLPSYNDRTGKVINDSGVAAQLVLDNQTTIVSLEASNIEFDTRITNNENNIINLGAEVASHLQVPVDAGNTGRILTSSGDDNSTWLTDGTTGQVLTTDGAGVLSWGNIVTAGGDVTGPNSSVDFNIALFDGITGKLIKDSGRNIDDFGDVVGPDGAVIGNLSSYNDATGKIINDSGIAAQLVLDNQNNIVSIQASNTEFNTRISTNETDIINLETEVASHLQVPADTGNTGRILTSSGDDNSTWLTDGTTGQVLTTDGAGVLSWENIITAGGDVTGPGSSTNSNIALFDGATGKVIKDSGRAIEEFGDVFGKPGSILGNLASYNDTTGKQITDSGVAAQLVLDNQNNITAMQATLTDFDVRISSNETNITNLETEVASHLQVPNDGTNAGRILASSGDNTSTWLNDGVNGQVLTTSGSGTVSWQDAPAGGDVFGKPGSIVGNLSMYNDTTGKYINDSGIAAQLVLDNSNNIDALQASNTEFNNRITNNETNITGLQTEVASHLQVPDDGANAGRILASSGDNNSSWLADGATGQFLATDGAGVISWQDISSSGGDVVGPVSSIQFNLASYNDATGKIINDSGVAASQVLDNQTNIAAVEGTLTSFDTRITNNENNILNNTTNLTALQSEVASHLQVPDDVNNVGRLLTSSGDNSSSWLVDGASGQVLTTDGAGVLSWENIITAGGDVTGPGSSTNSNIALFDGATGKVIKDSGRAIEEFGDVFGKPGSILGNLASYNDTTGKQINDSGVAAQLVRDNQNNIVSIQASNTEFNTRISTNETDIINLETEVASHLQVPVDAGNTGRILTSSGDDNSTWLVDGVSGQVLTTDGAGVLSWENIITAGGDVTGPGSSGDFNIALFDGITGKLIKDSGRNIDDFGDVKGPDMSLDKNLAVFDGVSGKVIEDGGININDIGDVRGPSSAIVNSIPLYLDTSGKTIISTLFSFPMLDGLAGQVLMTDGLGSVNWESISAGDVIGPATSTDFNIALFDGGTGKVIKDSGVDISDLGDVNGPDLTEDNQVALFDGTTGKIIKKTDYKLPIVDGNAGEVLTSDGNGNVSFQPATPGGSFGGIKICEIEMRLDKGKEFSISDGKNDVRWDAAGPYGADCSWISYGNTTSDGDYDSGSYFSEITLPAGNYMVDAWVSFQKCGKSWVDLYNETDDAQIRMGGTANAKKNVEVPTNYPVKASFSLGGQKTLKMRFAAQENDCKTSKGDIENNPHELSGQMVIWKFN